MGFEEILSQNYKSFTKIICYTMIGLRTDHMIISAELILLEESLWEIMKTQCNL